MNSQQSQEMQRKDIFQLAHQEQKSFTKNKQIHRAYCRDLPHFESPMKTKKDFQLQLRSVLDKSSRSNKNGSESQPPVLAASRNRSHLSDEERELERAFTTYLNEAGPGDYQVAPTFGSKHVDGTKKNYPEFSFKAKTKITYFP